VSFGVSLEASLSIVRICFDFIAVLQRKQLVMFIPRRNKHIRNKNDWCNSISSSSSSERKGKTRQILSWRNMIWVSNSCTWYSHWLSTLSYNSFVEQALELFDGQSSNLQEIHAVYRSVVAYFTALFTYFFEIELPLILVSSLRSQSHLKIAFTVSWNSVELK